MKSLTLIALLVPASAFASVIVEVPEPSSFSLMALALGIAAFIKFRNRNK